MSIGFDKESSTRKPLLTHGKSAGLGLKKKALLAGGLSFGVIVAPLIGAISLLNLGVKNLCNSVRILNYRARGTFGKKELRKEYSQRASDLKCLTYKRIHEMFACTLGLVPLLGIAAGGLYLKRYVSRDVSKITGASLTRAISRSLFHDSSLVKKAFYPLRGGKEISKDDKKYLKETWEHIDELNGEQLSIDVYRGKGVEGKLNAYMLPAYGSIVRASERPKDKGYMVIFHPNCALGEDMFKQAEFYQEKGYHVLVPTMGGYGTSDPKEKTSDVSSYQDALAVIDYLKKEHQAKKIAIHGQSIGATLALTAAKKCQDVCTHVVVDQPFSSAQDVGVNIVQNYLLKEMQKDLPAILQAFIEGGVQGAFPKKTVYRKRDDYFETDHLSNMEKIKQIGANILISRP